MNQWIGTTLFICYFLFQIDLLNVLLTYPPASYINKYIFDILQKDRILA